MVWKLVSWSVRRPQVLRRQQSHSKVHYVVLSASPSLKHSLVMAVEEEEGKGMADEADEVLVPVLAMLEVMEEVEEEKTVE